MDRRNCASRWTLANTLWMDVRANYRAKGHVAAHFENVKRFRRIGREQGDSFIFVSLVAEVVGISQSKNAFSVFTNNSLCRIFNI